MDLSAGPLIFADAKAGVPFLVALIVGAFVALSVPLLRRWPPTPLRWRIVTAPRRPLSRIHEGNYINRESLIARLTCNFAQHEPRTLWEY